MLTRENMLNGTFVRVHEALLPANMLWDAEKIRASMNSTLGSARRVLLSGYLPTGH